MSYASRADLVARFGAAEIEDLSGAPRDGAAEPDDPEPGDPEAAAAARIDAALTDASAEIDSALAVRYVMPLPAGPWPRLVAIACELARLRLYDDAPPEAAIERARAARASLAGLAAGKAALIGDADNLAPQRLAAPADRAGPEPAMTRDNLAGF